MSVCFVDIGGIVDHHCLNFLFITIVYMLFMIQLTSPTGNTIVARKKSLNLCNEDLFVVLSEGLVLDPHKSLITVIPK